MPATNDINEGVLGAFKVLMGKQPQLTLLHYNFLAMFFHNNTETFVKKKSQHEDFKYLYKMAQNLKGEEDKLKSQKLQDHVEAFINAGAPGFERIKMKTKVGLEREALSKGN